METEAGAFRATRPEPPPVRAGGKSAGAALAILVALALTLAFALFAARPHRPPCASWSARYSR